MWKNIENKKTKIEYLFLTMLDLPSTSLNPTIIYDDLDIDLVVDQQIDMFTNSLSRIIQYLFLGVGSLRASHPRLSTRGETEGFPQVERCEQAGLARVSHRENKK